MHQKKEKKMYNKSILLKPIKSIETIISIEEDLLQKIMLYYTNNQFLIVYHHLTFWNIFCKKIKRHHFILKEERERILKLNYQKLLLKVIKLCKN